MYEHDAKHQLIENDQIELFKKIRELN